MSIYTIRFLLMLVLGFGVVNYALAQQGSSSEETSVQTKAVWIDVRSTIEYQFDYIEGDKHIPHGEIVLGVSQLFPDKTTPIKLYCRSGVRSGKAAKALLEAGYINIKNVGGITEAREQRALINQ